jgi:catechol 2,3-dioxygenase-like lactoylglutathione lyase family enzyme
MTLRDRRVHTTLPVPDIAVARGFWEGVLGFVPLQVQSTAVIYRAGEGSVFAISRTGATPSGRHTQMAFTTPDVAAEVADLRSLGITFLEYDLPTLRTVDGIAQLGPNRAAWFNDPQGNLIGIVEFGPEDGGRPASGKAS